MAVKTERERERERERDTRLLHCEEKSAEQRYGTLHSLQFTNQSVAHFMLIVCKSEENITRKKATVNVFSFVRNDSIKMDAKSVKMRTVRRKTGYAGYARRAELCARRSVVQQNYACA